jgi:hypothetical protein
MVPRQCWVYGKAALPLNDSGIPCIWVMSGTTLTECRGGSAAMYLWMPMVAWSVVKLVYALIEWRARIGYERARAASVVDVLRAAPAGVTLRDRRADGTMLCIETRACDEPAAPQRVR